MSGSSKQKAPSKPVMHPLSVRFTKEERGWLEREAGKLSLSAYIRMKALGDNVAVREARYLRKQRTPQMDHKLLAQLLGTFGASELGRSMLALSLAAQSGALPVDDELATKQEQACEDIQGMRDTLILALGIKPQGNARS